MVIDPDSTADELPIPPPTVSKPLLASEALMEELAPRQPWDKGARWWSLLAAILLLAGAAPALLNGVPPTELAPALAAGSVAALCGLLPLPYVLRAVLMFLAAVSLTGVAFAAMGPAVPLTTTVGIWWAAHAVAVITLPAALMFRDRFRALARARYVLVLSLVLSLGFVGFCVISIVGGGLLIQVASGIAIAAVVLSLLGFMEAQASIGGSLLSGIVAVAVLVQLATVTLSAAGTMDHVVAVAAFAAIALLGAVGAAMLLAAGSYRHARSIDFRRTKAERGRLPSLTSDTWSGRR